MVDKHIFDKLRDYAASLFRLGPDSIHGPDHWVRVESHVLQLAPLTGADLDICLLFAIFHDSCRFNDSEDPEHGPRAAEIVRNLDWPPLLAGSHLCYKHGSSGVKTSWTCRMNILIYALEHHTDGRTTTDATIGTCWDADRLDLPRAGIIPAQHYMSTAAARERV